MITTISANPCIGSLNVGQKFIEEVPDRHRANGTAIGLKSDVAKSFWNGLVRIGGHGEGSQK